ncbi:hypothetical protein [Brevibacterium picturae]|uniref:Uncharacterized protein n=1 Tax=Brevibacterium picturae TaxID=260553 RepID=A0ABP4MH19_9MICO
MRFIDLVPTISQDLHLTSTETSGCDAAMSWLDTHPDQAPGRTTVTRNEYHGMIRDLDNGVTGVGGILDRLGIPVVDPEPTNVEKLTKEILTSFNRCEFDLESSFEQLAKALDARGIKAPGVDDE